MNKEKLAKLEANVRTGGKGTVRRKKINKKLSKLTDEHIMWKHLEYLNMDTMPEIDKIQLINNDKTCIEILNPGLRTSMKNNFYVTYEIDNTTVKLTLPNESIELKENKPRYVNKSERKIKKLFDKVETKIISQVNHVQIEAGGIQFFVDNPEVHKLVKHNVYIIYGKMTIANENNDKKLLDDVDKKELEKLDNECFDEGPVQFTHD